MNGLQGFVWVKSVGYTERVRSPSRVSLYPALLSPSRRRPHDSWGGDATETVGRPNRFHTPECLLDPEPSPLLPPTQIPEDPIFLPVKRRACATAAVQRNDVSR